MVYAAIPAPCKHYFCIQISTLSGTQVPSAMHGGPWKSSELQMTSAKGTCHRRGAMLVSLLCLKPKSSLLG